MPYKPLWPYKPKIFNIFHIQIKINTMNLKLLQLTLIIIFHTMSALNLAGQSENKSQKTNEVNMLLKLSNDYLDDFVWINQPNSYTINKGVLKIKATKGTDFFNNPSSTEVAASAPLLHKLIEGDFVAVTKVKPDFSSMWNAVSLMVFIDSLHWIKFAFENSDATGKSIVTVITNNRSDDANGVILDKYDTIWLKMIKKSNVYSMQWSIDGIKYKMARIGVLPQAEKVKVGIEAQCPVGESASHEILSFNIDKRTVKNLRTGE